MRVVTLRVTASLRLSTELLLFLVILLAVFSISFYASVDSEELDNIRKQKKKKINNQVIFRWGCWIRMGRPNRKNSCLVLLTY